MDQSKRQAPPKRKAYKDMTVEEKWRWHFGTQYSNSELELKRKEWHKYIDNEMEAVEVKLKNWCKVSWGIWIGALIAPIILRVPERTLSSLMLIISIILIIAYKLNARSERSAIYREADKDWPEELLWPNNKKM